MLDEGGGVIGVNAAAGFDDADGLGGVLGEVVGHGEVDEGLGVEGFGAEGAVESPEGVGDATLHDADVAEETEGVWVVGAEGEGLSGESFGLGGVKEKEGPPTVRGRRGRLRVRSVRRVRPGRREEGGQG